MRRAGSADCSELYERIVGQIVAGRLPNGERLPSESRRAGFSASPARRRRGGVLRLAPIGGIAGLMRGDELRVALAGETSYLAAQRRTVAGNASNDQQQERKHV
jgi:hypothetical protein